MIRRKQKIKTPSMWSRLGWIERIIIFGGPVFIIYVFNKIIGG
tara:strand:+ start:2193 stop:2321 length:129 start_codon:yes stop_codon:yes gene_type:complete